MILVLADKTTGTTFRSPGGAPNITLPLIVGAPLNWSPAYLTEKIPLDPPVGIERMMEPGVTSRSAAPRPQAAYRARDNHNQSDTRSERNSRTRGMS